MSDPESPNILESPRGIGPNPGLRGETPIRGAGSLADGATVVVALPHARADPGSSPVDPSGEELLGDQDESFLPGSVASTVTELGLGKLRARYRIPQEIILEVPLASDRVCTPPPGRFALYRAFFSGGVRLPLCPFFLAVCRSLGLAPCALMPNSWRYICAFTVVCSMAGFPPTVPLFWAFFSMKEQRPFRGWWFVTPRRGQ